MGSGHSPRQSAPESGSDDRPDDPDDPSGPSEDRPAGELAIYRTVIVDDHELVRTGTRRILEEAIGFIVVGEAADAESARIVVADTRPDLVITDIRLPSANGIDLGRQLVADHPDLIVVVLSAYDDEHYVRAAMAAGVSGFGSAGSKPWPRSRT